MTLWENYRNVCFIAPFAPPLWSAYAIVTAWNPASRWVEMRRNARRQRALSRQLADALVMGPVWGSDPDECWQEASLLLRLPRAEAMRLAARFGIPASRVELRVGAGLNRAAFLQAIGG